MFFKRSSDRENILTVLGRQIDIFSLPSIRLAFWLRRNRALFLSSMNCATARWLYRLELYDVDRWEGWVRRLRRRCSSSRGLSKEELWSDASVVAKPPLAMHWLDECDCERLLSLLIALKRDWNVCPSRCCSSVTMVPVRIGVRTWFWQ